MTIKAQFAASSPAASERASAPPSGCKSGEPPSPGDFPAGSDLSSALRTYTCDSCGEEVGIGSWPFCPHGSYRQTHGDLWYTDYNIGPEPITFRSAREVDQYAKANNLVQRNKIRGREY